MKILCPSYEFLNGLHLNASNLIPFDSIHKASIVRSYTSLNEIIFPKICVTIRAGNKAKKKETCFFLNEQ